MNATAQTHVKFCVRDVVHPAPEEVLSQLFERTTIQGEVVAVTDDGSQRVSYLVVKVQGVHEPIIIPADKTTPQPPDLPVRLRNVEVDWKRSNCSLPLGGDDPMLLLTKL